MSEFDPAAFDAFEEAGWDVVASRYDELWGSITAQAVDALLDAARVERGMRVLDVGCGPGAASGRAAERGADATGVDVSAAMVEIAARRHPAQRFVHASATELPFSSDSFDAAVGNIMIQHVGEPEAAVRELARVLRAERRVALSTWDAPERSPFFAVLLGAVGDAGVPPPSEVPPGPSFFQFAEQAAFRSLLEDAGFGEVEIGTFAVEVPLRSVDQALAALAEGTVRVGALVRAANDAQLVLLRDSMEARLEPWRRGDSYSIPASMMIASGRTSRS